MNARTPSRFRVLNRLGFALLVLVFFPLAVGAAGVPPAPGMFDPFEREPHGSVTVRGHVVQIHFVRPERGLQTPPESVSGSLPPFTGEGPGMGVGGSKLPHYSSYFFGRDSTKWRSRVGHYQNIIVSEVWPGIDVEYCTDQQGVETIYHVKPGADPSQIQMEYLGIDAPLRIDSQGNLILTTSLGDLKEKAPFAFQQETRVQKRVDAGFRLIDETRVGYSVSEFDAGKELVVDPLIYSTLIGGWRPEWQEDMKLAADGTIVLLGSTSSDDFPVTQGAYQTELEAADAIYVTRLSSEGLDCTHEAGQLGC